MKNSPRIEAVLWDLDGTLVDSEPLHEEALRITLEREGLHVPDDLHRLTIGRSAEAIYDWFRDDCGLSLSYAEWNAAKNAHYVEHAPGLKPRDGALDVFYALCRAGHKLAAVSNGERIIVDANLRALGLEQKFHISVSRSDVERGKPHPDPFLWAARQLGVDPARTAVVEDSIDGASAGVAAGMRTYLIPQLDIETPPGAVRVDDFAELARALLMPTGGGA